VQQSPTLDTSLKKGIPITENDRFYLISFLSTLTDSSFIKNPVFSDPQLNGKIAQPVEDEH
jgi:cytochrome c peroxidase